MDDLIRNRRGEKRMIDYDPCEECRLYGDDYSYDEDGELISNCYDCPMRGEEDEDHASRP